MLDFEPFYLTLKLAFTTTCLLFIIGIPIAHWLAFSHSKFKVIVEAFVGLPVVLPPSVLGFYLLLAFSPENSFGRFLELYFNIRLVFTFPGLVIASVIYSLPFMIQPVQSGFRMIPETLIETAYTLGKSRLTTLTKVLIPNIRIALLTGCVLSFAHTIGEFGVVLMVGGNIPKETRVVSVAIYDEVQAMNYHQANVYSAILLVFAFLVLVSIYLVNHRMQKARYL
ncbi:MAG: molybdate ABC transporter permease subunit [Cyclobacteriaceae bacterium]|jgi:molybdate transport system permease protein|nr:molybdate ABC transporter permease subunit [Cyclobacteriaceae bacterium]MDH4294888.1 molybdate ABC transporter permease subunit [Cyclobacteriaceae bacterium]MDH5248766.1 molybdate ABC transporter permease subunit [Cyclobacteriaceae bacterium]